MKKRILSIVLSIVMLVSLLPTTALANETPEARWVFGAAGITPDYTGAATGTLTEAFAAANENTDETNKVTYVQLNTNVTSSDVSEPFQLNSNKSMVLDLNGNDIAVTCSSGTTYGIYTNNGSSLTVKDGTITVKQAGSFSAYGIYAKGELTVENCTVNAENSNNRAYGIYANQDITVSGGSIRAVCTGSSNAYGVYLYECNMTISNSPAISGTTADIYLSNWYKTEKIILAGALSGSHLPYSVDLNYPDNTFANSDEGNGITVDNFSDYFVSADNKKEVVFDNGELKLVSKPYVSFYTGNGTSIDRIYLPYSGGTATRPADPTWEGYTFDGWYTDGTYTTEFDFDQTITQNTRVYAKWTFAATGAEVEDSRTFYGIYGSDLDRLIEETLSKLSIKVTGADGASLGGFSTSNWTVKEGQELAAAQLGDTVTFVGKLTAPTATKYSQWYGRLPLWEGDLAVEVDVVLDYIVQVGNHTYITNDDGIMAYRTSSSAFDIQGYFGGKWKQTSFSNYGYETYLKVGENTEEINLQDGGHTVLGLNVDIDFDFLNDGQTLQIKYTVKDSRTEGDPIEFSLGSGTDIQIGGDDGAIIMELQDKSGAATGFKMVSSYSGDMDPETEEYAQFNFFGKGYKGVTDVSDFWYGAYSSSYVDTGYCWSGKHAQAVFYSNENSLSGAEYDGDLDSAATWHWDDSIKAGETKPYSILIGIGGAGSENAAQASGLTAPDGTVELEITGTVESIAITMEDGTPLDSNLYTFDPTNNTIKFKEGSGLNVGSGDLTVTVTFEGGEERTATITNSIPGTGNVSTEDDAMDNVTAEGLDELAKEQNKDIVLTVKKEDHNENDSEHSAINTAADGKTVEFLDITLEDKNENTPITGELSEVLEIAIPFDADGKSDITVYRYHESAVNMFTALDAKPANASTRADGKFFVDAENNKIYIYTKKFSTYAIGYTTSPTTYTVTVQNDGNGAASASHTSATAGTQITLTATPASGYHFKEWQVVSGGVTVSDNKFEMPASNVEIKVVFEEDVPGNYTPTYAIIVEDAENGEVKANRSYAASGTTVTITVDPEDGYALDELTVTDSQGNQIEMTDKGNGTFTFKMPSRKVTIEASFVDDGSFSVCPGDHTCPIWPYTDAEATAWYHDGVHYCIENGLMTGYGNGIFKPNTDTSRAMIVTILWRLEGEPVVNYLMQFEDIPADTWYTEAVRWAASEKIVEGYGDGKFGTNDAITREQMVTIMFRYAKYKGYDVSVGENTNILSYDDAFDVAEWAIPAMQWACGSGMIQGIADGNQMNLAPQGNATRAQAAAILQRFIENVVNEG